MSVTFFTDRDLGHQFPTVLTIAQVNVERHSDHFPATTPDEEWLARVAERGWVAVTHDSRIRYKPNELAAVIAHNVRLLVLVGKVPHAALAANFVATLASILKFLEGHQPPFIGRIYRASAAELAVNPASPGRVELWYPKR